MKKQKWIRKGMAFVLSLAMVAGLVPAMSGGANKVQAAPGSGTEPSVSAYATKEQLMDDTFAPKADGTAENYGKIVFGKNSSGTAQEWYILGKDTGISVDDNTIIFAASPIATGQRFNSSDSDKIYNCEAGTGYWGDAVSITVHANHYGASDLRVALQAMAADTSYFTTAEQGLMNATTVKTMDAWEDVPYTTTDKLYALAGDGYPPSYNPIKAGSSDSTVLAMSSYCGNVRHFWLRSPFDGFSTGTTALCTVPSLYVSSMPVLTSLAVQPASNLNLSSVLFASSAKAASSDTAESGPIADGTAMTLRLDASATAPATAVGTVMYDASDGVIAAQKNADATGTVSLVVQGKGTIGETEQDWYYSVPVGGTIVVTKEQIQQKLSLSAAPNLADCKIWLETTIDNVAYASTAKAVDKIQVEKVNSVAVTDVKPPVGGEAFNTAASCNTKGIASITPAITYTTTGENGEKEVTGIADWNTTYKAAFTLTTGIVNDVVYVFDDSVSVTVDEESLSDALAPRVDGTVTVTREFTTAKRKIVSVAPAVPTDNTFTTYYGFEGNADTPISGISTELGNQAMVTLEGTALVDSTNEAMNVTWTIANDGEAAYDRTPGAKNTFRWVIPASEFPNYDASACQGYDAATGDITDTVTITNKAATPVTITGTDSGIAYTGATIDVSDYFDIDTNAGAATYSLVTGVDGGTGVGTLSGTTLTVTKTGTFKIKVETLANGIYGAGEKTITLTVSNGTIEYTATDYSGTYDGQPHSISVNVTNPEGTIISYSTDGENYGSDNPSFTNAGNYTVYYRITKDNYNTISENSTVNVAKAASAPNKPDSTMDVDYGKKKVSDITTLPEGWAWQDEDKDKALTVGTAVKATAVYTGADKGNYEVESVEISITRAECTHETTEVKNEKDATCTEKGYTGDTCCTVCGKVITAGTDINALGHDFAAEFTVDKEATCKEAGSKSKHCSRCDAKSEVTEIPVDKTKHGKTEIKDAKDATCTEKGYTGDTYCKDCGEKVETGQDINALGHDMTKTVSAEVKATCTEAGKEAVIGCSRCDHTEGGETIDALGHDFAAEFTVDKEATCTEVGSKSKHCSRCDEVTEVTPIPKKEHTWDAGKVTKEATETAEGVKTYTCSVCGRTKTEAIPKKTATTQEPPKKGDVVADDKTSVKVEVSDVKKKEVEYKEPANKKAKTISIPATVKIDGVTYKVTKIDDNAFKNNKTVTKVTVGSNIKTIGKNAFSGATKLKTVKIGKNVTEIGANAFKGCSSLTSVTLPSKATKIGANAFNGCKKLKTIKITSTKLSSKTVAKNAFKGLTKATTIKVPKKKLSAYKKLFKQKVLSSKVKVKVY